MDTIQVSASILSADLLHLEDVAKELEQSDVDMLHFDVMDGIFVPNLTFGMLVLAALRRCSSIFLDVHLMIQDPIRYIPQFAKAGADLITFHLESESDPKETIAAIRAAGVQAGIVLKPGTPYEAVLPYLPLVDVVLVMTVEPGFGGQSFMWEMVDKVQKIQEQIAQQQLPVRIEVDGGIHAGTAKAVIDAGASILVMGSALFSQEDNRAVVQTIREIGKAESEV